MLNRRALLLSSLCLAVGLAACSSGEQSMPASDQEADTAAMAAAAPECKELPVKNSVEVKIQGNSVVVEPDTATVKPGGQVTWSSDHPMAVFIEKNSQGKKPTGKPVFAKGKGPGNAKAQILAGAPCGEFKYDVAVYDETSETMLTKDPVLIIVP